MQQVHHLLGGRKLSQPRLDLPHIGIARSEIGKEDNHCSSRLDENADYA